MNNIFVKALVAGTLGTILAFLLNLVIDFSDNTPSYYIGLWVAIVAGSYIGFRIHEKRNKKSD